MNEVPLKKGHFRFSHTEISLESEPNEKEHSNARPNEPNSDKKISKHARRQEDSLKGIDAYNVKVVARIRETFLNMRQKTIEKSRNCVSLLRNHIPFDEPDEAFLVTDPILLLQYIKQIFDKTLELKSKAEEELEALRVDDCDIYEPILQQHEEEIRQRIGIEQHLKLILQDTQADYEDLQKENIGFGAKVKVYEKDIYNLKSRLARKIAAMEKLERQIENLPVLKRYVKEMDRLLDGQQKSQRNSKQGDLQGVSISSNLNDPTARKSSRAALSSSQERRSYDKNKDSSEYIRIVDASQIAKDEKKDKSFAPQQQDDSRKASARGKEREKAYDGQRARKSSKGGDSKSHSHSRERQSDSEAYSLDNRKDMKSLLYAKIKEDMKDSSKLSYDAMIKAGMEKYLRKSVDKSKKNKNEGSATKKTHAQVIESLKEKADDIRIFSHKNSISKNTRPGTGGDRSSHHDHVQHSADRISESFKQQKDVSSISIKKSANDRSQSVEPKKRLLKQNKSKESIFEEESVDRHKLKGAGTSSKVNQSKIHK